MGGRLSVPVPLTRTFSFVNPGCRPRCRAPDRPTMARAIFWTTEAVLRSALNEQDEDGCRSDKVNWPTLIRPVNARMLGIICALLAAMPNLIGCESSRRQDYQFEKQVKRAQECRQLQDKLVGDQPLTPERGEEIANTMAGAGCTARLPSADAGVPPRLPAQR